MFSAIVEQETATNGST